MKINIKRLIEKIEKNKDAPIPYAPLSMALGYIKNLKEIEISGRREYSFSLLVPIVDSFNRNLKHAIQSKYGHSFFAVSVITFSRYRELTKEEILLLQEDSFISLLYKSIPDSSKSNSSLVHIAVRIEVPSQVFSELFFNLTLPKLDDLSEAKRKESSFIKPASSDIRLKKKS